MCTLKISKRKININEIENFIEDICDKYNIQNSFHGNVIISITEMITLIKKLGHEGLLTFSKSKNEFIFQYLINSKSFDIESVFDVKKSDQTLETEYEKSIFLIMALCDDFRIDGENAAVTISFKNEGIEKNISSHRKEYLKTYLGKTIETIS